MQKTVGQNIRELYRVCVDVTHNFSHVIVGGAAAMSTRGGPRFILSHNWWSSGDRKE